MEQARRLAAEGVSDRVKCLHGREAVIRTPRRHVAAVTQERRPNSKPIAPGVTGGARGTSSSNGALTTTLALAAARRTIGGVRNAATCRRVVGFLVASSTP